MNVHPQFAEALALYAMGTLDDLQDLAALQAHLGTCGDCRRELEALRADMALLALSAVGPQPPARSRERLLGAVAAEPRLERVAQKPFVVGRLRPRWLSITPIAVMLMLAVFSLLLWRDLRNTRRTLRHTHAQLEQTLDELKRTNAELAEARPCSDIADFEAVIETVLVTLMREAIELCPNLTNLGNDKLLIRAASVRRLIQECPLDVHVEAPRAGQGHLVVENVGKLDDLSRLHQLDSLHH